MEQVFSYIIGLGAAVMMPILFFILGVCIGIKPGKALKSGLLVGVGFVGLSVVTALLTSSLGAPLKDVTEIYGLQLRIFDMGWPAAASVAYNTTVGAFIIPVCLAINIVLLLCKATNTINIDLWNYWHYAFIGAVVYFATESIWYGFFAAIICFVITLVMADLTTRKFQSYYKDLEGISIPQPFCQGFVPFAEGLNWCMDRIPGFNKLDIDAEGMKKKFGVLGEPLLLGVLVGILIGCLSCRSWGEVVDRIPYILGLGIKMGAVMELIPRITSLFIEGLKPIAEATKDLVSRKFKNSAGINIGMSPALVIGHPTTLVLHLAPGGSASGERIPAPGLAGGHVLCVPGRAARHQGQRGENLHHRLGVPYRGPVLCDRPGAVVHPGRAGCICPHLRRRRGHSGRLPGRGAGLCLQHLLLGYLPPGARLQAGGQRHPGDGHHCAGHF